MTARRHVQRPEPMYMAVARDLANEIKEGRYEAGQLLPSENELVEMFGVGKATVRQAVAELRGMGLVYSRQGKGVIVRERDSAARSLRIDRSIQRAGKGWQMPDMAEVEPPAVSRITLDGMPAALLEQADQDAISVDRLLHDPESGARMAHRMIIPMATAADTPSLAKVPTAPVSDLYRQLSDTGHALSFTEEVTARTPFPDERSTLQLVPDASPLLITYRITSDADSGRPLLCEELRAPAATCRFSFPVTPTKAAAKRAPRSRPASE
ncbi:GntR family transcriptional regulator [Streptomyces sp. NPDC057302]|uniref:GntR family transcriptional regulator n=1 Tax=Streptomyces sp. NPDC057302 TaxID=3346094 RepID=UPI0036450831